MPSDTENQQLIKKYYGETAEGAYDRWQAGVGGYHFTFYNNPSDFSKTQIEDVLKEHRESQELMLAVVGNFINPNRGDLVIDAGCGEGGMFPVLENLGARVVGLNIVSPHLLKARERIGEKQLRQSFPIEADYLQIPLPEKIADKVLFLESLTHSPDQKKTIEEAIRILKVGGEINIIEPMLLLSRFNLDDKILEKTKGIDEGMALWVTSLADLKKIADELNLEITDVKDVTDNTFPSMQLAANSAEAHEGDEATANTRKHRLATIAYRDLVTMGEMRYFFVKLKKGKL